MVRRPANAVANRIRFSIGLTGGDMLVRRMRNYLHGSDLDTPLKEAAHVIKDNALEFVPRDTGLLESEIGVWKVRGRRAYMIGVKATSEAYPQAVATEYGTWNYTVGTPKSPKKSWPAKSKANATMPWLRSGFLKARPKIRKILKRAHEEKFG